MAKGPIVTPRVEALIASVYQKHPKWKAPMVRNEVEGILHKRNPHLPIGWPSLSTVQKILATIRKSMREMPLDPRDKPWSTTSMADYPISPEALPLILHLWVWTRENLDIEFTIREAQWAARLYAAASKMPVNVFSIICRAHATTEMIYERIGASRKAWHSLDLLMFGLMTGQKITSERIEKMGLEEEEEELYLALTEEERSVFEELFQHLELSELSFKEAQNERKHKAKR